MKTCLKCNKKIERRRKYCSRKCAYLDKAKYKEGDKIIRNVAFGSGKERRIRPYRFIYKNSRFVMEHYVVLEEKMGRKLKITDQVFHINGDPLDNRIENLRAYEAIDIPKVRAAFNGYFRQGGKGYKNLCNNFHEDMMFFDEHLRFLNEIFGVDTCLGVLTNEANDKN